MAGVLRSTQRVDRRFSELLPFAVIQANWGCSAQVLARRAERGGEYGLRAQHGVGGRDLAARALRGHLDGLRRA
ncbi:hypothetical protein CG723_13880 [Streptomyces sp. CB01635]|nr:hypothetical protein CG723_13880 [Streptomyces sp. CB01635]